MRFTSRPQDAFRFELNYHSRFRFYVTITCTIVQTLFLNHPIDINTFFFYRLQKLRKQRPLSRENAKDSIKSYGHSLLSFFSTHI